MAPEAFRALLTSTLGVATETKPAVTQTVSFTTYSAVAAKPAPAAKSQASPATIAQTETPASPREIQTAKSAKPLFNAPLKVSIHRVTPRRLIAKGLSRLKGPEA